MYQSSMHKQSNIVFIMCHTYKQGTGQKSRYPPANHHAIHL